MKANMLNRAKAIVAMEYLIRCVNNEELIDSWLMCGVADGDIEFGNFDISQVDRYYTKDENFNEICEIFMKTMARARKDSGLFFDYTD